VMEPCRGTLAAGNGWRGPGWRVFDASAGHGKQVRDWVTGVVSRHGCPADPGDAALVVSELFTNALVHGPAGGQVLVGYCLWPRGARIVVCDGGGAAMPRLGDPADMDEGGRGLQVVDAVAAAWGSFRTRDARVVWCDLGKPLDSAAGEAFAWLRALLAVVDLAGHCASAWRLPSVIDRAEPARAGRQEVVAAWLAGIRAADSRLGGC
jgi:anti-sigma regulatory factor (Ser/Thr protein kinase)